MKNRLNLKCWLPLLLCLLLAAAPCCAVLAETAGVSSFSVTYVEKESSFTDKHTLETSAAPFTSHQFEVAQPAESADFLGWSSLPNGLADYQPGDSITVMGANPHATLYAVYGIPGENVYRYVVEYVTNGHYRSVHYTSSDTPYHALADDGYIEGFAGWSTTEGGEIVYQKGDSIQLEPAVITQTTLKDTNVSFESVKDPSVTLYAVAPSDANFLFTINYECGNGPEAVVRASVPSDPNGKSAPVFTFILDGPEGMQKNESFYADIIGWSETKGGPVNYDVNTPLTMQYNVPEKTLYAVRQTQQSEQTEESTVEEVVGQSGETVVETVLIQYDPVWSSDNPDVVTVDPSTGVVTAVSAGQANVYVQQQGQISSVSITVSEPPLSSYIVWDLDNTGVAEIQNRPIPSNAIIYTRWETEVTDGSGQNQTLYYLIPDVGELTLEEAKNYFGHDFGDWFYETYSPYYK